MPRIIPRESKIKIAVVGCGRISQKHFEAINAHDQDLELVAVCDSDEKQLKAAVEKYKVKGFETLRELLKESDAHLITLCTPRPSAVPVVIAIL